MKKSLWGYFRASFATMSLLLTVCTHAQNGATFLNNEQWVDGIGITGTQQIYAAPAYNWGNYGGVIHWINARNSLSAIPVPVIGNAFGNLSTLAAPVVTVLPGSCGRWPRFA